MNKSFEKYQEKITCDIRNSAKSDPKKIWNILNRCSEKSRQSDDVSLDELYIYFKVMNEVENYDIEIVINLNENNHGDVLNAPISQAEIENVILILHNDKSSGLDNVTNEYLKNTVYFTILIYVKLFNFIFTKGVVPVSWFVGVITPIFKNKGSSKDPKNYRAFTLMSCLGKVFTGILNNRLASLSDEIGLLSSAQAGFRNSHTTIWRVGLWQTLIENNISGKCFNVIKSLYQNVKSCVSKNGQKSDDFACKVGVR